MPQTLQPLGFTSGQIALRLSRPLHIVDYVIRSRNIEPVGRVGRLRVFLPEAVTRIESEIRRIERDREPAL